MDLHYEPHYGPQIWTPTMDLVSPPNRGATRREGQGGEAAEGALDHVEGQGGAAEEGSLDHVKGLAAITRMLLESKSEI
jgi:hypothetical protein